MLQDFKHMESELSAIKNKDLSPVPIRIYQWDDLRKAREAGGYPWTHLLKPPLQGEITAEDIIRETTPRRSMSREASKSPTRSPIISDVQKILNLDSSPGSSRKHGDEGEDEGVHIPNFSKEVSLDEDETSANESVKNSLTRLPESQASVHLISPVELPKMNTSPKSILKRRIPDKQYIGVTETREKTKCCHPLVNKIKHLADKTLHKLDRSDIEKSPLSKRKRDEETQEIRQLKSSPGAVRRQKFSAIKLGSSDEMSKSMCMDTPPPRKNKEHVYEDIEESKHDENKSHARLSKINIKDEYDIKKDKVKESALEKTSSECQGPSLVMDNILLKSKEYVMEKLHKTDNINKEASFVFEEIDQDEPNLDEVFRNQLEDNEQKRESPNITITEITDDDSEIQPDLTQPTEMPIETSPSPSPLNIEKRKDVEFIDQQWSKPNSDHEYEIIEKPPQNIIYTTPSLDEKPMLVKTDDDLSSTTSTEKKYLQHTLEDEEQTDDKNNIEDDDSKEGLLNAEALQKNIEDRFFVSTPSSVSRTECEISTSQVDSSALEQLPLKRDRRTKNSDINEKKLHQRFKDSTGKLKLQAGKLKMKLQSIKTKKLENSERHKINSQESLKLKMPEKAKFSLPEKPKFTLHERRKFSLPERPKFKKFTLPERPKLNIPDFPKFKMPEKPKLNLPTLRRKKEYKIEKDTSNSMSDLKTVPKVDFEVKTYPRLFNRKKKTELQKTSSSPTLNREDTPPPTFTFEKFKKCKDDTTSYIPDSPEQPREYGTVDNEDVDFKNEIRNREHFEATYDFDKLDTAYMDDETDISKFDDKSCDPKISLSKQEYTHVITEINNDEFFVRPRGISREDIQVREYLNDETRQAFNNPKNTLAFMGQFSEVSNYKTTKNDTDINPKLKMDDNEPMKYSNEDLNDRDDGYYTFPPIRPSRAKRKKPEVELTPYIDDSVHTSMQFSEVDLSIPEDMKHMEDNITNDVINFDLSDLNNKFDCIPSTDLQSIHEYANEDIIQYPTSLPIQSQTLPMPPKRKKKNAKNNFSHSSLNDFNNVPSAKLWEEPEDQGKEDIIVYRTQYEYITSRGENAVIEQSPLPPRRNRSRSSRGTSLCDDDRTSHGADSLTLDIQVPLTDDIGPQRNLRQESPGYATVDKNSYLPSKGIRRSRSQTPPVRHKSNSSERKYYTVGINKGSPDRPPRKKSSTSLMTLGSFTKRSISGDLTQYVEIDEAFEAQKIFNSGDIVNKMKDRPLPPPPRPPRESRRRKNKNKIAGKQETGEEKKKIDLLGHADNEENVIEIEVSTQTDPLPDDVDFELGIDDNLDISMSSSLRDIVDDDSVLTRSYTKVTDNLRFSRPTSRSEKSFKVSDPKISELSKPNIERTSPTVILVEKRVSSPTRINEHEEMLTEASLTVQHINIDESHIPDVPPLPISRGVPSTIQNSRTIELPNEQRALERIIDSSRDVQLDNLVTQRLQVKDLDVGRLNVSELQANKILVSDIEGMTLQVAELDSKSGHISVSGIEFSQSVIDEIVKKFAEISTSPSSFQVEPQRLISREEETQTDEQIEKNNDTKTIIEEELTQLPSSPKGPASADEGATPPKRPPPPDLTPLLYSYLQDITIPPASFYPSRSFRERPFTEFHESQLQTPAPPTRRTKRKPASPHNESSSEDGRLRPSPRRIPSTIKAHEPTIVEAGTQFLRVCQNSISRTVRNIFNSFMAYISGTEDKKDVQMALVIILVLVAGLLMFGLSDSRTIHHHHWEFFNPSDGNHH